MSVKLSELVSHLITDSRNDPSEVEMQTIVNAVERVAGADIVLRLQIEQKMRNYTKKIVPDNEIINCLTLTNFVVQNSPTFRTQVCELSFVGLLQQVGKMKKLHNETNDVEDKVRELIAVWGTFYPCELSEYNVLYQKYCARKIINPHTQPTTFLPSQIIQLIPHVEHNLRNISRALETGYGDLDNIYMYAFKISKKYEQSCSKCLGDKGRYDPDSFAECVAIGKRLAEALKQLKTMIDKPAGVVRKQKGLRDDKQEPRAIVNKLMKPKAQIDFTMPTQKNSMATKVQMKKHVGGMLVSHSYVIPEVGLKEKQTPLVRDEVDFQTRSSPFAVPTCTSTMNNNAQSPDVFAFDEDL
ncbi:hypothetical protein EIN_061200 [Entamoeba invadens IP1]|uniref:VHS domain-containing protein n=1 Tax=Entamoeba invadens TaxID=33085 RepID=S0B410_ENTIV|nr:hypothetical protein EIN_061200 [Entamoeba invadens IP1]ELP93555.1 hypothetical protein EIN_061200 [Entamoeba invadens IP1]BAN42168.1 hypothetical protein [Entamoeba invadens]|eukprot:XP_004260326.1 hypothetical protein EIN_061200 [Entamoeba invadens IP1]